MSVTIDGVPAQVEFAGEAPGIVVAIAKELGIPIRYVGVGEKMNDLIEFNSEAYINGLFD